MNDLTIYRELVQRSPEWIDARAGLVTASAVGRLIVDGKPDPTGFVCVECSAPAGEPCIGVRGKPIKTMHPARHAAADAAPKVLTVADNDTSRGLIATLAAERITRNVESTPMTSDMWRGVLAEPFARDTYADWRGVTVEEVGFIVRHFDGYDLGYSPDGLVGDDGLIEVKAPRAKTHVATIVDDTMPAHHMAQIQCGLLVTGRKWCDFISFSGGMPLYPKRITADPAWAAVIQAATHAAETAITATLDRYTQAIDGLPMTEALPDPYAEITV